MSTLSAGAELPERTYAITRADLVAYADASGDQNPIHQDETVAKAVGLPNVIAHGMYTLALAARAVEEWTDGAEVVEFGARFAAPVVVPEEAGAQVLVSGLVTSLEDGLATLNLQVTSAGQKVLAMPKAVVRVSADA